MEWVLRNALAVVKLGMEFATGQNPAELIQSLLREYLTLEGLEELDLNESYIQLTANGACLTQRAADALYNKTGFTLADGGLGPLRSVSESVSVWWAEALCSGCGCT